MLMLYPVLTVLKLNTGVLICIDLLKYNDKASCIVGENSNRYILKLSDLGLTPILRIV